MQVGGSDQLSEKQSRVRAESEARPVARFTARDVGSFFVMLIGLGIGSSALIVNPLVGRLVWGARVVDRQDVLWGYVVASLAAGALVFYLGGRIARDSQGRHDGYALLGIMIAGLVVFDRLLLVDFGLPLWVHDAELHYRHRPSVVRTLARAKRHDGLIRINAHGFHDTEFPEAKPAGELRGLFVGDSITMGDQVVYAETFVAQLEELLRARSGGWSSVEMINAGVHGYATYQEAIMMRRSLRFEPDFVVIGFCMNDLTEPSVVARGFADADVDYHHVVPTSSALRGYLMNETGLGRLAQSILGRGRTRANEEASELERVRRAAVAPRNGPELREVWDWVLRDLEEMVDLARSRDLDVVLVVFPFTFQLLDEAARVPQQVLGDFGRRHDVPVLDLTDVFEERIYADRGLLRTLREAGVSDDGIERVFEPAIREIFLDNDHLAPAGHSVVAGELMELLSSQGVLPGAGTGR